jgi:peroxiredoxin
MRRREHGGVLIVATGLLSLVALLAAVLRPVKIDARESVVGARVIVLADTSRSMALKDGSAPRREARDRALADLAKKEVVVVVFTCNSCPVATDYEDRILAFVKKYAGSDGKVGLVAINVNTIAEDKLPKMKERAEARKFDFPYLYDETQKIGRDFGAAFTPEFFVLDKNRQVVYMGGMDDNSNAAMVKHHYLDDAVTAALAGKKPAVAEAPAIGCRVRYARMRRTKAAEK